MQHIHTGITNWLSGSRIPVLVFALFTLFSCNTIKPYYGKEYRDWKSYNLPDSALLEHTIYLIGDGGDMTRNDKIIAVLNRQLRSERDSTSSIVFLGDNIYLHGLPDEDASDREEKEEIIEAQMEAAAGYSGNVFFIPGNHDWDYSGPYGLRYVNNQENYVEAYFDSANVFRPDNGCPGPDLINLSDDLALIVIDTEWWLHPYEVPVAPENGCTTVDKTDFIIRLDAMVRSNEDKHIMIVAHHPIISNGNHGGHYNIVDHIFPLRLVRDNLYVPLPLIGSIYPVSRKLGVSPQDIPNTEFQEFKNALLAIIQSRANVIYATGHDHNLQLNESGEMHHIISGSASKINFAARGFGADYVHQQKGYARVKYYGNGETWAEFFIVNDENPNGMLAFRKPLYALEKKPELAVFETGNLADSIVTAPASSWERRGNFGAFLFGNGRLNEWLQPVSAPVFDPSEFKDGIQQLQKSGARSSISLTVEGGGGSTFLIQPVEKYSRKGLSTSLLDTWLMEGVNEQNRANHPYGNLITGALSDSFAPVTSDPELFYIPVSPAFGNYMDEFGGTLATVERTLPRTNTDSDSPFDAILTTRSMVRRLELDPGAQPDAQGYLKERILDLLTGNFSRDPNDWRWLSQPTDTVNLLRPVSVERKEYFPRYDGFVSWLRSRVWNDRQLVSFADTIRTIDPFIRSSAALDERILAGLTWKQWDLIFSDLKSAIDNASIRAALNGLPHELTGDSKDELYEKLIKRWADMDAYLLAYYMRLSENVSINGTGEDDTFSVKQLSEGVFDITVTSGRDNKLVYNRVIEAEETDELRLYGLAGDDLYTFDANPDQIMFRLIPGDGDDIIRGSEDPDIFRNIHIYEAEEFTDSGELGVRRHRNISADTYWSDTENDYTGGLRPVGSLEINPDDHVWAGIGFAYDKSGFRKKPWAFSGQLMAHYATSTGAFTTGVNTSFYSLLGKNNDLLVDLYYADPIVFNYFGDGNSTTYNLPIDNYRVKMKTGNIKISVRRRLSDVLDLSIYTAFNQFNVMDYDSISVPDTSDEFFSDKSAQFVQLGGQLKIRVLDKQYNPEKGFRFNAGVSWNKEFSENFANYVHSFARLSLYVTPNLPIRMTFASRIGYEVNTGDFYFYQSQFLGGLTNLRGYRRTRFAGQSVLYFNNEIRLKLIRFRNDLINGSAGVFGFYDLGKVWDREGKTGKFHMGYGPGAYVQIMDRLTWRISYGISEEDQYFVLGTGFLF